MHPPSPGRAHGLIRSCAVTHPSLHIRTVHDAHVLLEAVRRDMLPLLKRRLLASEREELRSGHVYVWEEAQDDGGLLRWTDGRRWSQSRMRGDYLFYEEKVETTQDERDAKAARRARKASDPTAALPPPIRRKDRPSKPNGLTKQTYSVTVHIPGCHEPRKWHVVAYFSANDYARLPVVDNYAYLRNLQVPPGIFFSNKLIYSGPDRATSSNSDEGDFLEDSAVSIGTPSTDSPVSPTAPYSLSPSLSPQQLYRSPSITSHISGMSTVLPPITQLAPSAQRGQPLPFPMTAPRREAWQGSAHHYTPLSSEDRRVLGKLRVVI